MKTYKITMYIQDENENPEALVHDLEDIDAADGVEVLSSKYDEVDEENN